MSNSEEGICEHQIAALQLQQVLAALVVRLGGTIDLSEAELDAVMGVGFRLNLTADGRATVEIMSPEALREVTKQAELPQPTHDAPDTPQ